MTTPTDHSSLAARPGVLGRKPERVLAVLLFIVIVGGWELLVHITEVSMLVAPPPSATIKALWAGIADNTFVFHTGVTLYETLMGFFFGAAFGLVLGALIAQFGLLERTLYPYVVAFQTVPKVAIAPLIVIWFGFGIASKIVITATIAFFPVLANTIVGLRSSPREQLDLITVFSGSKWQTFKYVKIPNALPFIFVGLDVAIVLAIIGAIVGEFVGAQAGLGYLILQRNFSMDTAGVFAILIILSLMGIVLHGIVDALKKKVVFWANHEADEVVSA